MNLFLYVIQGFSHIGNVQYEIYKREQWAVAKDLLVLICAQAIKS